MGKPSHVNREREELITLCRRVLLDEWRSLSPDKRLTTMLGNLIEHLKTAPPKAASKPSKGSASDKPTSIPREPIRQPYQFPSSLPDYSGGGMRQSSPGRRPPSPADRSMEGEETLPEPPSIRASSGSKKQARKDDGD